MKRMITRRTEMTWRRKRMRRRRKFGTSALDFFLGSPAHMKAGEAGKRTPDELNPDVVFSQRFCFTDSTCFPPPSTAKTKLVLQLSLPVL